MTRLLIHYAIHFGLPLIVALLFFKTNWKFALIVMLSALCIDLDHILADPMYDPNRCSINFHPLHSYIAIGIYIILALIKKTRLLGIGLLIHIFADAVDCYLLKF